MNTAAAARVPQESNVIVFPGPKRSGAALGLRPMGLEAMERRIVSAFTAWPATDVERRVICAMAACPGAKTEELSRLLGHSGSVFSLFVKGMVEARAPWLDDGRGGAGGLVALYNPFVGTWRLRPASRGAFTTLGYL
ncbi:hypothetical protein [Caenispirillum bisanense]|uniref:Uncharacterized protein n=1 Tax=Caenispirillum bisanense TaxID=414052 RepID=A0A286GYW3_9PROT|nr:hypothetical protein [Caenispirillum bisanense]SOE00264.1 hypothetical protein SAMN05421508_1125 [Caenispirillum bisanense]